ncbi:long-chain-fatty-acid-CoA ligase [Angomonas deanei]|nr:long-chain-fatty-acid-CoA ligase [Angomonas deanei]|eukprot:EPY32045.1 long-chain-fatty-acid-CoA ligase [Angomonas deanei]
MFRSFSPLLAKVPYATLFEHNHVLQTVFRSPADKVALRVEMPGRPEANYTYGQLQRDVVELANTLAARNEAVAATKGEKPLSWVQPPRAKDVRSCYGQGEGTPSCSVLKDTGAYGMSVMCGPGYAFPIALLAGWSLNQLVTPMSVSQHYDDELMYVLEHSGSRSILGETALLKDKFPADYDALYSNKPARDVLAAKKDKTFQVHTVLDMSHFFFESRLKQEQLAEKGEALNVEYVTEEANEEIKTAQDVVDRIEMEREKQRKKEIEHIENVMNESFKAQHEYMNEGAPALDALCYDTDKLDELNPVFRRWHEDPSSRPTKNDDCLMIYTSGTTARPKGAVHTHASVGNMVRVLQDAWEWSADDSILHVLPVHHVHGLVNVLLCALASSARCVFTKFDDPVRIAHRLEKGDMTLFMAVPTIYTKMIAALQRKFSRVERTGFRKACSEKIRLMVSGSAALPIPTLEQFRELSGHTLLERYGMTEIGMALSQVLRPVSDRIPGTVGSPLPTVETYVYTPEDTEGGSDASKAKEKAFDEVGALAIASESLFDRYWRNPEATMKEMRTDAAGRRYFDTGDTVGVAHVAGKPSNYTILGRSSVDIIKSRGYKLSALEIEAALLSRKDLFYEMAVVGVKDEMLGEKGGGDCGLAAGRGGEMEREV